VGRGRKPGELEELGEPGDREIISPELVWEKW